MWMIGGQIHMEKRVAPMAGGAGNLPDEQRPKPQWLVDARGSKCQRTA